MLLSPVLEKMLRKLWLWIWNEVMSGLVSQWGEVNQTYFIVLFLFSSNKIATLPLEGVLML